MSYLKDNLAKGDIYASPVGGFRGSATFELVLIESVNDNSFDYIDSSGRRDSMPFISCPGPNGIIIKQQSLAGVIGDDAFNSKLQKLLAYSIEPKRQTKQAKIHTEIAHPDTPA